MIEEFRFMSRRFAAAGRCWGRSTGKDTSNGFWKGGDEVERENQALCNNSGVRRDP